MIIMIVNLVKKFNDLFIYIYLNFIIIILYLFNKLNGK